MRRILSKLAGLVKSHQRDIFLSFCIILISFISYNLGKIGTLKKSLTTITDTGQAANIYQAGDSKPLNTKYNIQNTAPIDRRVVVSKNSNKYHFTWCSGTKRIKEENKVWFADEAAAQAAGYTKAGNCPDF